MKAPRHLNRLFGAEGRVVILRHLLSNPGEEYFIRELCRRLHMNINVARRELTMLTQAGVLKQRIEHGGYRRVFYRVNENSPIKEPLTVILTQWQK